MKNVVLKTCLTTLVLAMSGLAAATNIDQAPNIIGDFEKSRSGYSVIAGGALSVAGESTVVGHVAAQAAVTIGAYAKLADSNVSAGAAVTIGAGAKVGHIYAAAAAGVAADASVGNITAGAAVTLGAPSTALDISADAAITMGAGSTAEDVQAEAAVTGATLRVSHDEIIGNVDSIKGEVSYTVDGTTSVPYKADTTITPVVAFGISDAILDITTAQRALTGIPTSDDTPDNTADVNVYVLGTSMGNGTELSGGVYEGSALNIPADSIITFTGDAIINLSDSLTLGANTEIRSEHSITWNVGSALNLGAGTTFAGTAFVNGSVSGATADICGNGSLYAKGAVAIGSVGGGENCL
jgi:hypothetical protein